MKKRKKVVSVSFFPLLITHNDQENSDHSQSDLNRAIRFVAQAEKVEQHEENHRPNHYFQQVFFQFLGDLCQITVYHILGFITQRLAKEYSFAVHPTTRSHQQIDKTHS